MLSETTLLAGIDAGGTTFKCALADSGGEIIARKRFETSTPERTLQACSDFFRIESQRREADIQALGVASFGPVDVDEQSNTYGMILKTPKPGWSDTNLKRSFEEQLGVPVIVDTDVNGALLAELDSGAAQGTNTAAYVTIGTGVGAGVFSSGQLIGKPRHPEFGHIYVKRHATDTFEGLCPFHQDCLEGMASAPAFTARYRDPKLLAEDHHGWDTLAYYLAQACWSLSLSYRPDRILLGGGIMLAPHILEKVRTQYLQISGGYLSEIQQSVERMIMRPAHGDDAGLMGSIYLARQGGKVLD